MQILISPEENEFNSKVHAGNFRLTSPLHGPQDTIKSNLPACLVEQSNNVSASVDYVYGSDRKTIELQISTSDKYTNKIKFRVTFFKRSNFIISCGPDAESYM